MLVVPTPLRGSWLLGFTGPLPSDKSFPSNTWTTLVAQIIFPGVGGIG